MRIIRSDIYENLKMALSTLRGNKLRSFLTVFGVVIGIITVMLIASIISGIDVSVTREVESFGTRSIYISKYNPGIHIGRMSREERMRKELTYDDAIALQSLPAVELSVPFLDITNNWFGGKLMVSGGGKTSAQVALQGTLPEFERAGTQVISEGRFFTQTENDTNQEVCVVGSKVADDFFKIGSPVGQTIKIGTQEFRVVGVLDQREQFLIGGGSDDQNNVIYVPFNVAQKLKPNADDIYILAVGTSAGWKRPRIRCATCCAYAGRFRFPLTIISAWKHPRAFSTTFARLPESGDRHGCYLFGWSDGRRNRRDEHHARVCN